MYFLGIIGILGFLVLFFAGLYGIYLGNKKDEEAESEKNHERFKKLVDTAQSDPERIRKGLNRLSYLGNVYLFILIFTIFITISGVIYLGITEDRHIGGTGPFVAALFSVFYIVIKSIYIKPEYPIGIIVQKDEYPAFFSIIEDATRLMNAPGIDRIYIVDGANAAVCFIPTGMGFKGQNTMIIGIHLLEILDEQELKSIIIHELAHIYNKDTKVSARIWNNILRWNKILEYTESQGFFARIFLEGFAQSYLVKMEMYRNAVSKQNEFIADQEAAAHTSPEIYARACTKLAVMECYLNDPEIVTEIRAEKEPPKNFYNIIFRDFYSEYNKKKTEWLQQIQKGISSLYDTHPSFKERMKALGVLDVSFDLRFHSGGEEYRREISRLIEVKNKEWYEGIAESWEDHTREYKAQHDIINSYQETDDIEKNMNYAMPLKILASTKKHWKSIQKCCF